MKFPRSGVLIALIMLSALPATAQNTPNAGFVALGPGEPGAKPLPPGVDIHFRKALYALRDSVYETAMPPADIAAVADALIQRTEKLSVPAVERNLILSRIEYLAGRAWQPVEDKLVDQVSGGDEPETGGAASGGPGAESFNSRADKKKAIARHEAAIAYAKAAMAEGETAECWMAQAAPLSQLCILKDKVYLVINGPKIGAYAKKALKLDPANAGARISLAVAKAYPPAIFGGNPEAAVRELRELLDSQSQGFEKDELFDLRAGIGTAYAKMNDKAGARLWFGLALELYPGNIYAKIEFAKAGGRTGDAK